MFDAARKAITEAVTGLREEIRRAKADQRDEDPYPQPQPPVLPGYSSSGGWTVIQPGQTVTISLGGDPVQSPDFKPVMPANKIDALAYTIMLEAHKTYPPGSLLPSGPWEVIDPGMQEHCRSLAKAALEFLRKESVTYGALASLILEDAKHNGDST